MKISVFYEHIQEAMQQEGLSEREVLARLQQKHVTGLEVDAWRLTGSGLQQFRLRQRLEHYGFQIATIYQFFDWGYPLEKTEAELQAHRKQAEALVNLALKWKARAVMAIPGFYHEGASAEEIWQVTENIRVVMKYLVIYAKAQQNEKVTPPMVVLEDFDGPGAIYSTMEQLESLYRTVPGLQIAFDTGNFLYSLQDADKAYDYLRDQGVGIGHFHLKDRIWQKVTEDVKAESDEKVACDGSLLMYGCPVGAGEIPIAYILQEAVRSGYDGYVAAEHFGMKHQMACMEASADWIWKQIGQAAGSGKEIS